MSYDDPKPCEKCGSMDDVLCLSVENRYSRYLCMTCYNKLQEFHGWLRLLVSYDVVHFGPHSSFNYNLPKPWRERAKNPHDWNYEVMQIDEQTSLGTFACLKCGGSWTISDKHQARELTEYDECAGLPLKES